MKIKIFLLSLALFMSNLFANIEESYPHRIFIGPELLHLSLRTTIEGVNLSASRFFGGLRLGYEYVKPCTFYFGIDVSGTNTRTDFNATLAGEDLVWQKGEKSFGNIELRLGYTYITCFFFHNGLLFSPFLGFGIYGITSIDHYNEQGYKETLPYIAAGARIRYNLCYNFTIGVNGKFLRTFAAEQKFQLPLQTFNAHTNDWGGEIGLPLLWHLGDSQRWDFELEPYYLKIASNIYGVRALFSYRF